MQTKNEANKRLQTYKAKRNFKKSPEPNGEENTKEHNELFFCVQKHLASHLHYDFRLEHKGVLLSWAVPKGPSLRPGEKRLAMRVEDHPFDYGEFEGVIPEGYGAGIVLLWDRGAWVPQTDVAEGLQKGELKFTLKGVKLKGSWVLVRTGKSDKGKESWLLIKHRDEWAGDIEIAAFAPRSVKSDKDLEDILADKKPGIWESHAASAGKPTEFQALLEKVMALKAAEVKPRKRTVKKTKASTR